MTPRISSSSRLREPRSDARRHRRRRRRAGGAAAGARRRRTEPASSAGRLRLVTVVRRLGVGVGLTLGGLAGSSTFAAARTASASATARRRRLAVSSPSSAVRLRSAASPSALAGGGFGGVLGSALGGVAARRPRAAVSWRSTTSARCALGIGSLGRSAPREPRRPAPRRVDCGAAAARRFGAWKVNVIGGRAGSSAAVSALGRRDLAGLLAAGSRRAGLTGRGEGGGRTAGSAPAATGGGSFGFGLGLGCSSARPQRRPVPRRRFGCARSRRRWPQRFSSSDAFAGLVGRRRRARQRPARSCASACGASVAASAAVPRRSRRSRPAAGRPVDRRHAGAGVRGRSLLGSGCACVRIVAVCLVCVVCLVCGHGAISLSGPRARPSHTASRPRRGASAPAPLTAIVDAAVTPTPPRWAHDPAALSGASGSAIDPPPELALSQSHRL